MFSVTSRAATKKFKLSANTQARSYNFASTQYCSAFGKPGSYAAPFGPELTAFDFWPSELTSLQLNYVVLASPVELILTVGSGKVVALSLRPE